MTLTKKNYKKRLIDAKIEKHLKLFGAVSVEGPMWSGKTWTVLNHANSVTYMMDKTSRTLAEMDISTALVGEAPHAIDEWQEIPAIWDAVRYAIDQETDKGRFLLTGSVTHPDKGIFHSGTGRISTLRMRTMTLFEAGKNSGETSLSSVFEGVDLKPEVSSCTPHRLAEHICSGGWPANLNQSAEESLEISKGYLKSLINIKTSAGKKRVRNPQKFRILLASLAKNNATLVTNSTLHNEVQTAAGEFSADTLSAYLDLLRERYILEEIPGWNPSIRSKTRILSRPKRFFTDPSLAAAALGVSPDIYMTDIPAFGAAFEGLCLRDLSVYAELYGAELYHYRDNNNLEIDAVMEFPDASWAAFEIKLSESGIGKGVKSLLMLKSKMEEGGRQAPKALVIITGNGICHKRADGIYIIPVDFLAP